MYRAYLSSARFPLVPPASEIASHPTAAVDGFRAASTAYELPRGLLTRAWFLWATNDEAGCRADLDEAWAIAERGAMKLFQADIHLTCARLFRDPQPLAAARELITACGYGRRFPELEDAERVLASESQPAESRRMGTLARPALVRSVTRGEREYD